MKHLRSYRLFEGDSSKVIEFDVINDDGETVGNVAGIIHTDMGRVMNWLEEQKADADLIDWVRENTSTPIAILKNVNIESDHRNKGLGKKAMSDFLDQASRANHVLLMADKGEYNEFDLTKWYESEGFKQIGEIGGNPLMIMDL